MCGRFTLLRLSDFINLFPWILPPDSEPPARYNIAPSQPVAVVPNVPDPKIDFFQWGLIPSWAKDPEIGNRMINARAETLAEKPSFRVALKRRRCLVPSDGFYEWQKSPDGKTKTPMYITLKDQRPFAFAGLWDTWQRPDGSQVPSFTIITTEPNGLMASIHNRMPVILKESDYRLWLDPKERPGEELQGLLTPYPAEEMTARVVSRAVNNPKNESPDCIASPEAESAPSGAVHRRTPPQRPPDNPLFP